MANTFNFSLQRLKTLPVKTHDETWEVDVITMPVSIREEGDAAPWNPVCAICASTRGGAMFSTPCRPEELTDSAALEAIASFAQDPHVPEAKPLEFLPPRVRVSRLPESMHEALAASLDELGIHLEVKTELPMVQEFTNTIATIAESSDSPIPAGSILKGRGVTIDHVRSFAEAAAAFYLARPWERIHSETLWFIRPQPKTRALRTCAVLGMGGMEFGLGFFASSNAQSRACMGELPRGTVWSMTYEPFERAPILDQELWCKEQLTLAAEDAFPIPIGYTETGRFSRPRADQLALMDALLRGFSAFPEDHGDYDELVLDTGTPEGELTLSRI